MFSGSPFLVHPEHQGQRHRFKGGHLAGFIHPRLALRRQWRTQLLRDTVGDDFSQRVFCSLTIGNKGLTFPGQAFKSPGRGLTFPGRASTLQTRTRTFPGQALRSPVQAFKSASKGLTLQCQAWKSPCQAFKSASKGLTLQCQALRGECRRPGWQGSCLVSRTECPIYLH